MTPKKRKLRIPLTDSGFKLKTVNNRTQKWFSLYFLIWRFKINFAGVLTFGETSDWTLKQRSAVRYYKDRMRGW